MGTEQRRRRAKEDTEPRKEAEQRKDSGEQRKAPCVANRVSCCSQTRRLSRSDVAMHPCSNSSSVQPKTSWHHQDTASIRGGKPPPPTSSPGVGEAPQSTPRKQGLNSNQNKGRKYKRLPGPYLHLEMILQVPPKVTKLHQRWGWFKGKLVVHPPQASLKVPCPLETFTNFSPSKNTSFNPMQHALLSGRKFLKQAFWEDFWEENFVQ